MNNRILALLNERTQKLEMMKATDSNDDTGLFVMPKLPKEIIDYRTPLPKRAISPLLCLQSKNSAFTLTSTEEKASSNNIAPKTK